MALTKISTAMISQSAAAVDLNVDAGTFYVDTTNNRVGVGGKTDPDTPLHVVGTATATLFAGSGASLTNIPNSALTNSSITINSTATSLGGSITLGTDDVAEGSSNLYYTNARADARIAAATTDDLSEGSSNLYYTDARVDARVSGGSLGNITTTGYIRGPSSFTIDPAAHGDDTGTVVIAGNLQVDGTTTTINSTTLTVDDKNITLASGSANAAAASGAGFTVDIGTGTNPAITYDGTNDEWDFNKPLNVTGNIGVSGTVDGVDIAARDAVLTSTTTTAGAALPKAGGAMTGAITTNSTFDGRDVATDGSKLDGIEANADVTDTTNVTAAGAVMDSELASIADVKALDQSVVSGASPTFTTTNFTDATDKRFMTDAQETKLDSVESGATADQTAAEIRTLVESASNSNVFTDADHSKLNGIEASATADQTAAEIRTLVESATDSNVFTDADHSKLNGIAANANNYVLPTNLAGDDINIDTGALTGATVISDLDFNITTNSSGLVTDANASVATRTLTLADLGYTGATNANNTVTNATHTGEVTGSGALTIANDVVDAGNLKVTGNGTTSQFLRSDGDGTFTWATPTDTNTTYSAGTGVSLSGTTFSLTDTNAKLNLTGGTLTGALDVSGAITSGGNTVLTTEDYDTFICHLKTNVDAALVEGAGNAFTVNFNLEEHNDSTQFTHTGGVVTVLSTGWYNVYANLVYENSVASNRNTMNAYVKVNGTMVASTQTFDYDRGTTYGTYSNNKVETSLYLSANDTLEIETYAENEDGSVTIESAMCEFIVRSMTVASSSTNADTVDGLHGSQFLRSDTSDSMSGSLSVSGTITSSGGGNSTNWNTAYGWGNHASQSYATQSYVGTAISNLVDSSPATLDTLNELAAALGDDPNFATTVSNSIGTKWTQDNTKISNWDTAYGWGNHASAGYLTSYTDTNTTYSAGTGISLSGTTFSLTDTNAKLNLSGGTLTGALSGTTATFTSNSNALTIRTASNGQGAEIRFSDQISATPQFGYLTYFHSDTASYGSGNAFIFGSSEASTTILADGKLMYGEGIYLKPATGTGAGTRKDLNWDTAYGWGNHASAGYLTSYTDTNTTYSAGTGISLSGTTFSLTDTNAKLNLSGGTMTGELQLNARLDIGSGTQNDAEIRIYKADNNISDHIQFYNGTTPMGEIGCQDTTWLRINQVTAKNIYTPRYIRADGGFFVDSTAKGINGSGNFIGGTITGASDANVSNWDTAYGWGNHASAGYSTTDTTYSVGDGGLTEINFTSADHTKLNGIAANANNYVLPTNLAGDDINIDTGALTGATVISDLDFNITTNTSGLVTDANASVATRTLTLANLGYTGATNANYITNNNQLTNGNSYITNSGGTTASTANTVVKRNSSGDINVRLLRSEYDTYACSTTVGSWT